MNRRKLVLLSLAAVALIAVATGAGYALGRSAAPTNADAAEERNTGRRLALADRERAARREAQRVRQRSSIAGAREGEKAGAAEGRQAGEAEVARQGLGPTPLDPPKLFADLYSPQLSGGEPADRPGKIILGNHSQLEGISWSSWGGEVAEGSGTLFEVVDCEPTCAEDPGERTEVTLKAWEPSFNPESVRLYSKLTIIRAGGERETIQIPTAGGPVHR